MNTQYPATAPEADAFPAPEPEGNVGIIDRLPLLMEIWRAVLRWKWVIVGMIAACVLVGLALTTVATRQFTATTRLEISRSQARVTNVEGVTPEDARRDTEFYQTQYSLLRARSIAERVTRALGLEQNQVFLTAFKIGDKNAPAAGDAQAAGAARRARFESIVNTLLRVTDIKPVRGSSLVDIEVETPNADLSARIANEWAAQFIQNSLDKRFASTADARKFLEGRLSTLRVRLEQSERELVNYASQENIVPLSTTEGPDGKTRTQRTLAGDTLEALNAALTQATADRIAAASRVGANQSTNSQANVGIVSLRQRRAELAADYAKMMEQFEPGYPAARALQSQISTIDQAIAREEGRVRTNFSDEYRQASAREAELSKRVDALQGRLRQEQQGGIQYNILQREVDTNRALYDALLQRYKEIGVAGVGSNNIAVVDAAQPPRAPSSPNLINNLMLSLLMGFGLSALAVFALIQIDESIDSPATVNQHLGLPLLGVIPDTGDLDIREELENRRSGASEAYLSLLTNLSFSSDHGVPRTLTVTSTRPGEGKSSTAYAISKMLARTGRRVVLIDGDMRSPSVHNNLNLENKGGLSNLLSGSTDWQQYVRPGGIEGLSIITAGPHPPSAAELLSGHRLRELLNDLTGSFDHVVIDAPPVLGLADSPLISTAVEGVIYVVETNGVRVRGIRLALSRLTAAHVRLLGVLLTKHDQRRSFYGYGYGYDYNYQYGSEKNGGLFSSKSNREQV